MRPWCVVGLALAAALAAGCSAPAHFPMLVGNATDHEVEVHVALAALHGGPTHQRSVVVPGHATRELVVQTQPAVYVLTATAPGHEFARLVDIGADTAYLGLGLGADGFHLNHFRG